MTDRITLPSGSVLEITLMPFGEAHAINQRLAKVLSKLNINIGSLNLNMDVMALSGPLCELVASQEVIEIANLCFKRCLIDNLKIDASTFEDASKRQDYIPAIISAIKANVSPFFVGLLSFLEKKL